jgi:molybdopterin-biosynthesis enzyme MoeA-like protein
MISISDDKSTYFDTFQNSKYRGLVITGGLGPTKDVTKRRFVIILKMN